jgi:hypothetical protein
MIPDINKKTSNLFPLFYSIIIIFIPFFITFNILEEKNYLIPMVAVAYVFQVVVLLIYFINKINPYIILLSILLSLIQMLPIVSNLVYNINFNHFDIINTIATPLNFLMFFGLMINTKTTQEKINTFMKLFLGFAVLACFYNIVEYWPSIVTLEQIESTYEVNLKSFFPNRNQFGMFLFLSLVAHHYLVNYYNNNVLKILIFILQISNLILTMSRGAILAMTVFYLFLYFQYLKNIKILFSVIALLSTVFYAVFSNNEIYDFIIRNILRPEMGDTGRSEIWLIGLEVYFKNNLITGVGYHTGVAMAQNMGLEYDQFHNFFVDTLVRGGILDLLFIISILIFVFQRFIKKCADKNYKKIYVSSVLGVLALSIFESVGLFSLGFVDTLFTTFFVSIPLLISNSYNYSKKSGSRLNSDFKGGTV